MIYRGYEIQLERPGMIMSSLSEDGTKTLAIVDIAQNYDDGFYCILKDGVKLEVGEMFSLGEAKVAIDEIIHKRSVKSKDGRPVVVNVGGDDA